MADPLAVEPVDVMHQNLIHNYLHLLAVTFLFYDHFITFGNEIEYLWRRHKTQSSYWFFLNRYFSLFGNISVTVLIFTSLPIEVRSHLCKQYNTFRQLFLICNQVLVCVLLTLRIYALYGRSIKILAYMLGSGAVLIGVACWSLFSQKSAPATYGSGCHIELSRETAIRIASAWEALFIYDSNLFILTLLKTWKGRHDYGITRTSVPIIQLILRDGAIYFAVMALANLTNILTFYLCPPFLRGSLSSFASAISVTMISRLMLNLHETADIGIYSTAPRTTFTNTEMECVTPVSNVELDTLWSSELHRNTGTMQTQSFRLEEPYDKQGSVPSLPPLLFQA